MANFVSYNNATSLMTAIGNKIKALNGAYIAKGNSTFANLPSPLTVSMTGFVYNVTDAFTTTADFVEGAGKDYPANTNVGIINIGDSTTPVIKYDVFAGFVDLTSLEQAIADVSAMIAAEFDDTATYAEGDLVTHEGDLYTFTAAHAAGAWSSADVSVTTVEDLLAALGTRVTGVNTRVSTIAEDIAPTFVAANAYAIDDIVIHEDGLYKFISAHTAGDPWSSAEVAAVTVADLVDDIKNKQDKIQYSTMPTASADYLGKVFQYIGTTTVTYTNGYFYKCVGTGDPVVYSWEVQSVQPGANIEAENVAYDNSESVITSDDVQGALDDIADVLTIEGRATILTKDEIYTFNNVEWKCMEKIPGGYMLVSNEALDTGGWAGYKMTGPTGSTGNPWGEAKTPYNGDIDGENVSSLSNSLSTLYEDIKNAELTTAEYGNGLFLIGAQFTGTGSYSQATTEQKRYLDLMGSLASSRNQFCWTGTHSPEDGKSYIVTLDKDITNWLQLDQNTCSVFGFNIDETKIQLKDGNIIEIGTPLNKLGLDSINTYYDNTTSGLTATDVQAAIDELAVKDPDTLTTEQVNTLIGLLD